MPKLPPKLAVKNERRIDLIKKEHLGGGVTEEERAEMDGLQREVFDYVNKRWPRIPPSSAADERAGGEKV